MVILFLHTLHLLKKSWERAVFFLHTLHFYKRIVILFLHTLHFFDLFLVQTDKKLFSSCRG